MTTGKTSQDNDARDILEKSVKLAYREYAEEPMASFYDHPLIGIPSRFRVRKIVQHLKDVRGRVLEIGCEAGYVCRNLSHSLPAQIFGIDPCSPALLDFVKRNDFPQRGIEICSAIGQELCFQSESFEAVVCSEVLEHTPDIDVVLSEISRILKTEGIFILTLPYERLRRLLYPLIKLFGVNTDIEKEVNLFDYSRGDIEEKLSTRFTIDHYALIFRFFPITYFYCCRKK